MVEDGHLIVLLDNTTGDKLGEIARSILRVLYGKPYEQPSRPIADLVAGLISSRGFEAAAAEYRRLKAEEPDTYDFGESQLNRLGYYYLRTGETDHAIEIFKLNVETYPEAFNAYDSLGEAYIVSGDSDLAILNYEKSLELNPDNTGATRMIEKIRSGE